MADPGDDRRPVVDCRFVLTGLLGVVVVLLLVVLWLAARLPLGS